MKKLFLLVFTVIVVALLPVQAGNYVFRHYTVDDGLPYNGVRTICQDRYGFMWFGLDNGLCRYDGVRMKTFRHNKSSADQFVAYLFPSDTCLWIGTARGLTYMRFKDEKFVPFTLRAASSGATIRSVVTSMTSDSRGMLWVSTQGQGVFCYDAKHNSLRQYPIKAAKGDVSQVVAGRDGSVWAIPRQGLAGLYRLNKDSKAFEPYASGNSHLLDYDASAMIIDSKGTKWIGTRAHGLISIAADGSVKKWLLAGADAVEKIHSLLEVRQGNILVGSDEGLALLETSTGRVVKYSEQSSQPGALSNRFVYPLVLDREGGIWIGTFYGGVNYVAPNSGQFESFVRSADSNSIGGNVINNFAEDKNGTIWIASDDGGLNMYNPATGRVTRNTLCTGKLPSGNVHGLWADDDCLWVGTFTGGICRVSFNGGSCRNYVAYTSQQPVADAVSCYSLFRDSHGILWSGSLESVSRYDASSDRFVFVKRLGALVIDINEDRNGNLWFATQGQGLFFLNRKNGKWHHFRIGKQQGCLPDNSVNCVLIDSRGRVIVASLSGLFLYDGHGGFTPFGPDLHGVEATAIVEDNHTYWIATVRGMLHYREGEAPRWFNKNDGLLGNQFIPNAIMRASDGSIYIGSNFGFNSFHPSRIKTNKTVPTVAITGLEILNKRIETGDSFLPLAINHTKRIDLSHSDNVFTITFAAQSYCTPKNNNYAFRLDGFDRDWSYVSGNPQATYTNLSPGTYTFRVKGTNNDGVWSDHEAVLKIVVHPPFYLSVPMKVLYLFLFIALSFLSVKMLLRRAEKSHREDTERIKAEKEREVRDAKIGFFTMIAHEIRTPVSLIIGPLENILKNTGKMPRAVSDDLDIIDRNAHRLLYLVNQLLDFRKVEQKSLVTRFTLCNISQLVNTVSVRFKPTFDQNGIDFTTIIDDENLSAVVDSEAITKVVSNFLTNAVKYGRSKVTLRCGQCDDGQSFTITVSDDGQGVRPEDRKRIFRPFFQSVGNQPGTGIGLSIVKTIVDKHNGTVGVEPNEGGGSVFTVTIPISRPDVVVGETEEEVIVDKADELTVAVQTATNAELDGGGERLTVLVVEDNEELLNFTSNNLRKTYNVITARNGREALSVLRRNVGAISLIISDWMMTQMDGDELCRRVRSDQTTSHLPFILLTAKTDTGSKVEGLRCGADSYIEKPFSMQYLEERVKNLINMRRMLREKFSSVPLEPVESIATTDVDSDFLRRMKQIIEENFSNQELSVAFLAERLSISRSGLFTKIKSLSGMTPNDMILLVRLKKAAQLLKDGRHQVNEVCYMVGFSNPSYFSKCFRRQFGITPSDFVTGGEAQNEGETTSSSD